MDRTFYDIVRDYYEETKPLFVNLLHKRFDLDYDDIEDIYSEVWCDLRKLIIGGKVTDQNRWKALIIKMGLRRAGKVAVKNQNTFSLDDETFSHEVFFGKYINDRQEDPSIYENPDIQSVLAAELSYIPEPCNKILRLFYYEGFSMDEIAGLMNYKNSRCAITTKNRCYNKLKERVINTVRMLGLI